MEAIILLGAPGAGKGTVAEDLKQATTLIHLSTGDMLREAVKAGRALGQEAKGYMERGALVPDNLVMRIVRERLEAGSPDDRYLFDGYPRNTSQAAMLADLIAERKGRIRHVFQLEVPRAVLVERISGRRICRQCGAVYHVKNIPPRKDGVCDKCGGELYQRSDDNEATVLNRLDVYETSTQPLIEHYEGQGLLRRVPAVDRGVVLRGILTHLAPGS